MYKAKGTIQRQEFNTLEEAQVVRPDLVQQKQINKPELSTKKASRKRRFERHFMLIACALVLLFGGAIFGMLSREGMDSGNIAVDDLTSLNIILNVNSQPLQIATNSTTVGEFLSEQQIRLTKDDYIGLPMDQALYDGMVIWLRLAVTINILVDGEIVTVVSQPITVQEALAKADIVLSDEDLVSRPLLEYLYEKADITVSRIEIKTEVVEEEIEQAVVEQEFTYLAAGSSEVIYPGRPGIQESVYQVTYKDGQEIVRVLQSSAIKTDPDPAILGVGPASVSVSANLNADGTTKLLSATTENGATFYYQESFTIETTAYTWTGNRTASGTWPKVGTIAVDTSVIPMGTKVYVVGYGFATAEDTGGAIKGNIIDLYMDTEEACINWGRRNVIIYILAE